MPFYYDLTTKSSIEAYFVKDDIEIPYIDLSTGIKIIETKINNDLKPIDFKINLSSNGSVSTLSRVDGSKVIVDFKNYTISFVNYDNFFKYSTEYNTNDVVTMSGRTEGSSLYSYLMRDLTKSYVINGKDFVINLSDYSIPMYYENETGYMPFQTFSDIFLAYFGSTYVYNRKAFINADSRDSKEFKKLLYEGDTGDRSTALIEFTYNELALTLDLYYGLKEEHSFTNAYTYLKGCGLYDELHSTNPTDVAHAIALLTTKYFADFHSAYNFQSFLVGSIILLPINDLFTTPFLEKNALMQVPSEKRKVYYPNGVPAYEEFGDTAYVTFDQFSMITTNYYEKAATKDSADTFGIIEYAQSQIKRTGSPIKNVVLDLSCNSGGALDSAAYTLGWVLAYGSISLKNTLTGTTSVTTYLSDTNMDH